tara:strand:+ start:3804 stop:4550 length:747 start_codon:yes stop_codon:yes gene_type:complete
MNNLNFTIITLSPKFFDSLFNMGIISKAIKNQLISINCVDLRAFGEGNYNQVDDEPYGGGSGMLLKPEPIYKAYESIQKSDNSLTLLMSPQGKPLHQSDFSRWLSFKQIIMICGQYEGFDERVRLLADEEVSIGDYVLSGGEIPAISIINGLSRLVPGTLGDPDSLMDESHNKFFLEYPQYTRPQNFRGMKVPNILLSGNHQKIKSWRKSQMFRRTYDRRSDLIISNKLLNLNIKNFFDNSQDHYPNW